MVAVAVTRRLATELYAVWGTGDVGIAIFVLPVHEAAIRREMIGIFPAHEVGDQLLELIDSFMHTVWDLWFLGSWRVAHIGA